MSAAQGKPAFTPRAGMPAFGAFGAQQPSASILFEKSNPGVRRSTPDSEALASSDDEVDQNRAAAAQAAKLHKPTRRTSWLNDVPTATATLNRKTSGTMPYSPTASNPGTPSTEQPAWTTMNPAAANAWNGSSGATPWGSIWSNQDSRKEPSRLQEVMSNSNESGIPFSIPLQPTPKTYRSQSYSVGQLESAMAQASSSPNEPARYRMGAPFPSLQRRTSRTAALGVVGATGLDRLHEEEGDEDYHGQYAPNSQALRIERLEKENAQLRAAQVGNRTFSTSAINNQPGSSAFRPLRSQGSLTEEYDDAVDDQESMSGSGLLQRRDNTMRRLSEQALAPYERQGAVDADGNRNAKWQTALGFGGIPENPQSRRHSMADVPTRHPSLGSQELEGPVDYYQQMHKENSQDDPAYFTVNESTRLAAEEHVRSYAANSPYGMHYMAPSTQPLHIVNFKCCRSDVYYVQEGSGLDIHVGDLVIVDADRGIDLGTVQHTNVTWEEARRYKEHYAEEHYKWLMMFSKQSRNGGPNVVNPNGLPTKASSAVGGMGPPNQHNSHDAPHGDLKPRLIKRLAANHEIMTLKEKEGNEAKAKRVCQHKVAEHRLNMEILDAEFQLDSKKLTFYYFADSYINFNSLVTDLFKIYKTRIWMSAINPAAYQTPTASLALQPAPVGQTFATNDGQNGRQRGYGGRSQPGPAGFDSQYDPESNMRGGYMAPFQGYPPGMAQGPAPGVPPFGTNMHMDPFSDYYQPSYGMLNPNAPNFASGRPIMGSRASNQSPVGDWAGRFQGLSLGS